MPLTYLDQNALIALGVKARDADVRKKLDASLESSAATETGDSASLARRRREIRSL
jgi:hypothetical protein